MKNLSVAKRMAIGFGAVLSLRVIVGAQGINQFER